MSTRGATSPELRSADTKLPLEAAAPCPSSHSSPRAGDMPKLTEESLPAAGLFDCNGGAAGAERLRRRFDQYLLLTGRVEPATALSLRCSALVCSPGHCGRADPATAPCACAQLEAARCRLALTYVLLLAPAWIRSRWIRWPLVADLVAAAGARVSATLSDS